jgi:hypothetical protein
MLDRAEEVVLIDAFPQSLANLKELLLKTAGRGVRVTAQTYDESNIPESNASAAAKRVRRLRDGRDNGCVW